MKLKSLHDLFLDQLRDMYNAENQIIKALPKMAKTASSSDLQQGFQEHLEQTRQQAERLERVFEMVGAKVKGRKCKAMEGLIEEGKEVMDERAEPEVMDAGLIAAAQKVEHYEIATYGCLITWAGQLGHDDAADLLRQNLDEEKITDRKLTQLAEGYINREAAEPAAAGNGAHHEEPELAETAGVTG
jgi:ferritin-like metal-binding protein YciE